jgi:hypothetical protein
MIANNYIALYESRMDDLSITANTEEIVGYYLANYEDQALEVWLDNINGLELTDQEKAVTTLLYILS